MLLQQKQKFYVLSIINHYLCEWNHVGNSMKQKFVLVILTKMRKRKAKYVEDVVQEIKYSQGAHQRMKISHHLEKIAILKHVSKV